MVLDSDSCLLLSFQMDKTPKDYPVKGRTGLTHLGSQSLGALFLPASITNDVTNALQPDI